MQRIQEIVQSTRRTGNTTWILTAAITQPNCIIVARNDQHANELKKAYNELILKQPWYRKLKWAILGRIEPKFMTLNNKSALAGYKIPVIFDNGIFC
jgi:hypothetical protein